MWPVLFKQTQNLDADHPGLFSRIKNAAQARRRREYWLTVVVLALLALGMGLFFSWKNSKRASVISRPGFPRPDFQLISVEEMRVARLRTLTAFAQVKSNSNPDSLRAVLDWVLYSIVDEYNRIKRQPVRVVWAYLYEGTFTSPADWRAMAIWVDPLLPPGAVPAAARIGGDAIKQGAVEYDFTNPVNRKLRVPRKIY